MGRILHLRLCLALVRVTETRQEHLPAVPGVAHARRCRNCWDVGLRLMPRSVDYVRQIQFLSHHLSERGNMNTLMELLGWAGVVALLTAYAGVSFKKISPTSTVYQVLNAAGGALFVANTAHHRAFPPTFLNSPWTIIAMVALRRRTA